MIDFFRTIILIGRAIIVQYDAVGCRKRTHFCSALELFQYPSSYLHPVCGASISRSWSTNHGHVSSHDHPTIMGFRNQLAHADMLHIIKVASYILSPSPISARPWLRMQGRMSSPSPLHQYPSSHNHPSAVAGKSLQIGSS